MVGVLQAAGVILERTMTGSLVMKTHFMFHDVHDVVDLGVGENLIWIIDYIVMVKTRQTADVGLRKAIVVNGNTFLCDNLQIPSC
jgi:hypothetical protein